MKRAASVIVAVLCFLNSLTAYAAHVGSVHLAVSGCKAGQVFSVNQTFGVTPVWDNGSPEYIGTGSLVYDWSPASFVHSYIGDSAEFSVPERQDAFEIFASARIEGTGAWISPSSLQDRIGAASVIIAGLADASSPAVNYVYERVRTRSVLPGTPFALTAEWRNASGEKTESPDDVRYEWTCDGSPEEPSGSDPLTLHVAGRDPGTYQYVCRAYSTSSELPTILCAVQFPVVVTADQNRTFSISSVPSAQHGVVFVPAGQTATLTAVADPQAAALTCRWQQLSSAGTWEDVQDASSSAEIVVEAGSAGTVREYRCLGKSGEWAGETSVISVSAVDPDYSFLVSPTDLCAPSGSGLPLQMMAAVSHSTETAAEAEWQYRTSPTEAWQPAALAVQDFMENVPHAVSPGLTVFSWSPSGSGQTQNGQYRCVCGGTASAPATLTITADGALGLSPAAPLSVSNDAELGSVLTGLDAPPAVSPITAADLQARITYPAGFTPRVTQHARTMSSTETVGTGCQIQLLDGTSAVSGGATVIMRGDVLGTGVMGVSQLVRISRALTEPDLYPLFGPFLAAGDFDNNSSIDLSDIIRMTRLFIEDNAFTPLQTDLY